MQTCFDDTRGSLAVSHCASEATRADLEGTALRSNYYLALGAAGALLHYLEQVTFHHVMQGLKRPLTSHIHLPVYLPRLGVSYVPQADLD